MQTLSLPHYDIHLGPVERSLPAFFAGRRHSRLLLLVDEHTEALCLPRLAACLPGLPRTIIRLPAGEQHKNLDTCRLIWQQMMDAAADRAALAVNLGGGVIGDMGGFCAATFKRGVDFVQIPTTLLAQVDASIGGKLGIDFGDVKNSIGLFRDPRAVFIDPAFLSTLPLRELRSGLAEIVKHALIADAGQWEHIRRLDHLDAVDWAAIIGPSLRIKQHFVETDPFEHGPRKALNFGHTVGHAVEGRALTGPAPLLHGEAIAIGMICEAFLSHQQLGLPRQTLDEICGFLLRHYGHHPQDTRRFDELLRLMANDKKNVDGRINFSLLPAAGAVRVNCTATPAEIERSLSFYNELRG